MDYVTPINSEQQASVISETHRRIDEASKFFGLQLPSISIKFDLSGRSSGMYRVSGAERCIRYNPFIFARYFEDSIRNTIPHDVAHFVTDIRYGLKSIKPHGREWRAVMSAFGVKPEVTAGYDLTGIPQRRQRRFDYQCDCQTHALSTVRHNKVQARRAQYFCRQCHQELVLLHDS